MRFIGLFVIFILFFFSVQIQSTMIVAQVQIDTNAKSITDTSTTDTLQLQPTVKKAAIDYFSKFPKDKNVRTATNPMFVFYALLSLVIGLGLIRFLDPDIYRHLAVAQFRNNLAIKSIKEKFQSLSIPLILLGIISLLSLTFYLYFTLIVNTSSKAHLSIMDWNTMLIALAIVLTLLLSRVFFVSIFGYFFNYNALSKSFRFQIYKSFIIIGIITLPFTILMAFTDLYYGRLWSTLSLAIIVLILLMDIIRFVKPLGSMVSKNKFHFFLYLCTAEILPIAILVKFFSNNML